MVFYLTEVELLCLAASHGAASDTPAPALACLAHVLLERQEKKPREEAYLTITACDLPFGEEAQLSMENDMLRAAELATLLLVPAYLPSLLVIC